MKQSRLIWYGRHVWRALLWTAQGTGREWLGAGFVKAASEGIAGMIALLLPQDRISARVGVVLAMVRLPSW